MPVTGTEDLKNFASHYLHNPSSRIVKLRVTRSRSGGVKVLIFLDIPVASGQLLLEHAPAIPVRVLTHPLSSYAQTTFLTAHLFIGSVQWPHPQPRVSSAQCSRTFSREPQHWTSREFWNACR